MLKSMLVNELDVLNTSDSVFFVSVPAVNGKGLNASADPLNRLDFDETTRNLGKMLVERFDKVRFRVDYNGPLNKKLAIAICEADPKRLTVVSTVDSPKPPGLDCEIVSNWPFDRTFVMDRIKTLSGIHRLNLSSLEAALTKVMRNPNSIDLDTDLMKLIRKSDLILGNEKFNLKPVNAVLFVTTGPVRDSVGRAPSASGKIDELTFFRALSLKRRALFRMALFEEMTNI